MFSTGQLIFAALFFVAFVIVMVWSYRKDINLHKKHYKGAIWVLVGLLVFLGLLFVIKLMIYN